MRRAPLTRCGRLSRRLAAGALLAGAWVPGAPGASAQGSWTIGRPEPLPEFQSPLLPAPKAAPAAQPRVAASPPPAAAPAAQPTFSAPGESAALDAVVVVGRPPGPALWRVRRGDSEVVVVGALSPIPHLQTWNPVRVEAALKGARVLLTTPRTQVGVLEGASLMLRAGALRLPGAKPLEARLPPALRAKFDAAVALSRQTPQRYAKWKPAAAGLLLIGDFRRAAGLSTAKPGTTLEHMAKADGVPVRSLARLSVAPVFDALVGLPEEQQLACLDAAVDEVNQEAAGARPAAQAWADGRLAEVKAHWATAALDRCILPSSRVQALLEKGTADATREVDAALRTPGRAVAVVDLHFLMRSDGLLDRLKAEGAEITSPAA